MIRVGLAGLGVMGAALGPRMADVGATVTGVDVRAGARSAWRATAGGPALGAVAEAGPQGAWLVLVRTGIQAAAVVADLAAGERGQASDGSPSEPEALYIRDPLPNWSMETCTPIGDACHPMMPFMAQGAGMAAEDAVVLARAMAGADDRHEAARRLRVYQQARQPRTSRVQMGSRDNDWLKGSTNADRVYGYDAWTVSLPVAPHAGQAELPPVRGPEDRRVGGVVTELRTEGG